VLVSDVVVVIGMGDGFSVEIVVVVIGMLIVLSCLIVPFK